MKTPFKFGSILFALALIGCSSGIVRADIFDRLISYWPLDVDNGGTTPDISYGNDMTITGGSTIVAGHFGNAFSFNGTNQYLSVRHGTINSVNGLPIYTSGGACTVTLWVKAGPQAANVSLFAEASTTNNNPVFYLHTDGTVNGPKLGVLLRNLAAGTQINNTKSATNVWDNNWHHLAWVDNAGKVTFYVDGIPDTANFNYTPAGAFPLNNTTIGVLLRTTAALYFAGVVDDVALWQRALSAAEVNFVRTNGIPTPIPPPILTIVQPPVGSTNALGDRATFSISASGRSVSYQWYTNGVLLADATNSAVTLMDLTVPSTNTISVVTSNSYACFTNTVPFVVLPDPPPAVGAGLVSYWPLDVVGSAPQVTTPDLADGNSLALTNMDSSSLAPGQFSNALTFDGATQYGTRVGGFPIYDNPVYTISLWVLGEPQTTRSVFCEASSASPTPLLAFLTEASGFLQNLDVLLRSSDGTAQVNNRLSARTVFDNTWHHLVWVDVNGYALLYVDGVLDETDFSYTRGQLTLDTTAVGALVRNHGAGNYFSGTIDEVAQWNRRLTWTEIQQIRTNGIPAPTAPYPPAIIVQPLGTSVFAQTSVTLVSEATGTTPLTYQWRTNGIPLAGATNASLALANLQPAESGDYSVVVTNTAGSATSLVAHLVVTLRPAPPQSLGVDIKCRASGLPPLPTAASQPGFVPFLLAGIAGTTPTTPTTALYGGVEVTISPSGGTTLADRDRLIPTNSGAFTEGLLVQDFIFDSEQTNANGIDITIKYLETNQLYRVTIWSWDSAFPAYDRISDWSANGTFKTTYTFNPTNNNQYKFSFDVVSDSDGSLLIQGRRNLATVDPGGATYAVYLNGFLVAVPPIEITAAALVSNSVKLVFFTPNPAQEHKVQHTSDLANPSWADVPGVTLTGPTGNTFTAAFPIPSGSPHFYRIVRIKPSP